MGFEDLGFKVELLGSRVEILEFKVLGTGLNAGAQGLGFWVPGFLGSRV